jgi:hypothetical protein
MMNRRLTLITAAAVLAAATLTGCAGLRTLSTEVSSFGEWPADRKPGSYAFERLPSQQARAEEAQMLETSAMAALAKAGFKPVEAGQQPDVLIQVGARDTQSARDPWDDPLWWRGGFGGFWGYGPWVSPRWGLMGRTGIPRYDRQVAVLIRDRVSGKPVFETRASSEGNSGINSPLLGAMFEASMTDFPKLGVNPRRVDVVMTP